MPVLLSITNGGHIVSAWNGILKAKAFGTPPEWW